MSLKADEKSLDLKNLLQGKYLSFKLGGEEYGVEIIKVKEIIGMMNITSLPQTPDFVKGVINLRGRVIPVIDLRIKFGFTELDYTQKTCIIVVEINENNNTIVMGIIVDAVSEVFYLTSAEIEETPKFGVSVETKYVLALAKVQGIVRILLNISNVVSGEEYKMITEQVA
jgi:purine-binding chemotaxis protein CheW